MIYESPIWTLGSNEISFVGELTKWTPVSPQRFYNIDLGPDRVYIYMRGTYNEKVKLRFTVQTTGGNNGPDLIDTECTILKSGRTSVIVILDDNGVDKTYCQDA